MSGTEQITELLLRWEELREQGRILSAEELCHDCPHLTEQIRKEIRGLEALHQLRDRATSESTDPDHTLADNPAAASAGGRPRPAIPGYEILEELGRGGMGVVYLARHLKLNRGVALKTILAGAYASAQEQARFRAEAEAIARLQHPNIVQIHEVGEHDGLPFLCLELVEGGSLAVRLARGPLPQADAARLVETLAQAIHHAHERKILHRDLKPANILLASGGRQLPDASPLRPPLAESVPKLTDFGLAKILDSTSGQTQSGAVLGTLEYMAPEQAAGKSRAVGPAADVYALGAILYECLTGRPPFRGEDRLAVLMQVLQREPERQRLHAQAVDPSLEAICLKCLEKSPEDRYPSAQALAEDLAAYRQGAPVLADAGTRLRLLRLLWRETRHTEVLAQWGQVLLWETALVFLFFAVFGVLKWFGVDLLLLYRSIVVVGGLSLFVPVWYYRIRGGLPWTPLEHQLAQVWCVVMAGIFLTGVFKLVWLPERWPAYAVILLQVGIGFGCTAAILGGSFYVMAILCGLMALSRVLWPEVNPAFSGMVLALGLLVPGVRYTRRAKNPEDS